MNKKIIIIVLLIILLVIGGLIYITFNNKEEQSKNNDILEDTTQTNTTLNTTEEDRLNSKTNNNINTKENILIIYYSRTGNTENVANIIHETVGGDIIELQTIENYPEDYASLAEIARREKDNNERPEIRTKIENIDDYDTIFIGSPIWFADMPMLMYTFLDMYDLSGKTICPFVTSGGSGLSGVPNRIKELEPTANVTEGLAINGNSNDCKEEVQEWVNNIGAINN